MRSVVWVVALAACGRLDFDPVGRSGSGTGPEPADLAQLLANDHHACVRSMEGALECWGHNAYGELAAGANEDDVLVPTPVTPERRWADVALGAGHLCALDAGGQAWCWGDDTYGQLGVGSPTCGDGTTDPGEECDDGNLTDGDGCSHLCRVTDAPNVGVPTRVTGDRTYLRIFAGNAQTFAIASDHTLWAWGRNGAQELGLGDSVDRGAPIQVEIVAPQVNADSGWATVGPGDDHTCAAQRDGSLWCWGANAHGELGQGVEGDGVTRDRPEAVVSEPIAALAGGQDFECGLATNGLIACWGRNADGQLGVGDTTNRDAPAKLAGTWLALATGSDHTCAIDEGHALACWGQGSHGELGTGAADDSDVPAEVAGSWLDVAAGDGFTCARDSDGVACWGQAKDGALGDADNADGDQVLVPKHITL